MADPPLGILVVGHTNSTNSDTYNKDLSERRAETVRAWLEAEKKGQVPSRSRSTSRSAAKPICW
ncbi:MAG: OmpA family protein [Pseudomonadota bacterium]|nr:OmpA family protein [Pseudomonadota bacterium]